jgi:hypothetical protein
VDRGLGRQECLALLHNTSVDEVVVYEVDHLDPHTRTGWRALPARVRLPP